MIRIKNCPYCSGRGEIKDIETKIKIGPFHLGKEYSKPCNLCNSDFFNEYGDKLFKRRKLHWLYIK